MHIKSAELSKQVSQLRINLQLKTNQIEKAQKKEIQNNRLIEILRDQIIKQKHHREQENKTWETTVRNIKEQMENEVHAVELKLSEMA